MVFMAPSVRPTNSYEDIDQETRNLYEQVAFFNGSGGPVTITYDRNNYGTVGTGETINLPKFVAEYYLRKNLNYKIVAGGDQAAIEAIDKDNALATNAELTEKIKSEAMKEDMKAKQVMKAKNLKAAAEAIEDQTEDLEEIDETVNPT